MLTIFTFWPTLRVLAVVAALYGSVSLPARDPQPPPSGQSEKPQDQQQQEVAPPSEEQKPEDAAKPSEDTATNENPPPPSAPAEEAKVASANVPAQLFHGTITHFNAEFVTVSRALVGKRPESRRFLILKTTKVHRALHVKAKVTVRYKHLPEGDVALEIQIHPIYAQKS